MTTVQSSEQQDSSPGSTVKNVEVWQKWWAQPEIMTSEASFREAESHVSMKKRVLYLYLFVTAIIWYEISGWIFGAPGKIIQIVLQIYLAVLCWPGKIGQWQQPDRLQIRAVLLVYITSVNIHAVPIWLLFLADGSWNVAAIGNGILVLFTGGAENAFLRSFSDNWEFVGPFRLAFLGYVTFYTVFDGAAQKGALYDWETGRKKIGRAVVEGCSSEAEKRDGRESVSSEKSVTERSDPAGAEGEDQAARPGSPKHLASLAALSSDFVVRKFSTENLLELSEGGGMTSSSQSSRKSSTMSLTDLHEEDSLDQIFYNQDGAQEYGNEVDDENGEFELVDPIAPEQFSSDAVSGVGATGATSSAQVSGAASTEGTTTSTATTSTATRTPSSGSALGSAARGDPHALRAESSSAATSSKAAPKSPSLRRFSKKLLESPVLVARFNLAALKAIFRRLRHPGSVERFWPSCRRRRFYKHMALYFPVKLTRTAKLDPAKQYIFGYHPHGIISIGAFINFATYATGFDVLFPGKRTVRLVFSST